MNGMKRLLDEEVGNGEKKMKGVLNDFLLPKLLPTLQHSASVELCVIFWKSERFVNLFTRYLRNKRKQSFWKLIDAAAATFIQQLEVPALVKQKLEYFYLGTADEILFWRNQNLWINIFRSVTDDLRLKSIVRRCVDCMVWTNRGLIDYEATARNICCEDFLCRTQRFQLASQYCLKDILRKEFQLELKKQTVKFGNTTILSHWAVTCRSNFLYQSRRYRNLYNTCSTNDYMDYFVESTNDVARKYFLDKLDVGHKEKLIRGISDDLSIDFKLYWLSQITVKERKAALLKKSPLMILSGSVLWEDVMTFYFRTFGPRFTGIFCVVLISNLFREYFSNGTLQLERFHNYVKILWNNITSYARRYVILTYKSGIAGRYSFQCLLCLFEAVLRCNDKHYLKEFFSIMNEECSTSTDEISRKQYRLCDNYVPKYNVRSKYFNWRTRLVFEFLTVSTFSFFGNPFMYRSIQDDIHDVFVEICLSGKTYEIEDILRVHFKSDIIAIESYKSSLIRPIFIKLRNIELENCKYWKQKEIFPATDFFLDFCFNECDELINKFKLEMELEME